MPFTQEEITEIKKQIISQVQQMPNENNGALIEQINQLDGPGLEGFLAQNNIEFKDGRLQQSETQKSAEGGAPPSDKPIFESIVSGELPSYKIAENDKSIAILELNPMSNGHCLIIPKEKAPIEKIPKSALTLAQKLAKRIKLKLKPEDIKIETFSFQDYPAINIIPIYKDKQLQKSKAEEKDLIKLQKKLETKTRAKKQPKIKKEAKSSKSKETDDIKPRIPY